MNDIPTLYPSEVEVKNQPSKGEHGYYRRGDNQWIITAPVWTAYRNDMEYKGYRFLAEYGTFVNDMPGNKSTRDVNGRLFSTVEEPWRFIFQRGGAKEFPISQIVGFHWDIRPPYREVVFPQLEGVTIYNYFCPECDKGVFGSQYEQEAIENLRIHLTCRTNDAHSYRPEDLRTLGEEYGIDFFAPRRGRNSVRQMPQSQTEAEYAPDLSVESDEWPCTECGVIFDSARKLSGHRMGAHKRVSAAPV